MEIQQDIRSMKGIGEQRAKLLNKLGIFTMDDLLSHFPRSYEDRTQIIAIADTLTEQPACVRATVAAPPTLSRIRKGMELVKLRAFDDSGSIDITFFNQSYVRNQLLQGETYLFYGKIGGDLIRRSMTNPDYERTSPEGAPKGSIQPRYALCKGISNKIMMNYVRSALDRCGNHVPDALPDSVREAYQLVQAPFAYENIHFPSDFHALELARQRLIFEELFVLACALGQMRCARQNDDGIRIPQLDPQVFFASLQFSPTNAQCRAVQQIFSDLISGRSMNRLVQGDVGSGKTLVAAAAAWAVCCSGKQTAFMAPTEILAEQHLATLRGFLSPFGLRVEKLTGSMSAKEKRELKNHLAAGQIDLLVGTHALLTGDVEFSDLALVITDEQHRFGVRQRSALGAKGQRPHTLVMSATPIPRTLALMIYGDLDVSVIDELPPGRQKVDTFAVDERYRTRLNSFIEKLVGEGRQVFVVCPMVEENEESELDLKSATEHAAELSARFPSFRVGCIHGRMKAKEKESIMSDVIAGKIDILVSTTVIEVGLDVPNAALMIVENAERFGLSQLHQLRGRVGRGSHKSYCVLVSDSKSSDAQARLKVMCRTNDGFQISEEDLQLRGPGDFFGSRQHGLPEMHIASLCGNMNLLQSAQSAAQDLLKADPLLTTPGNQKLRLRISQLFELHGDSFN